MTIYMVVNTQKPLAGQVAQQAGEILQAEGARLVVDGECAGLAEKSNGMFEVLPQINAYKECDIVLCVGGDGTMLHAARQAMEYDKPLLGINVGRLGFLTIIENDELSKLSRLMSGEYTVEYRDVLRADLEGFGNGHCLALNDVVLFKKEPERTISLDIYCDDILVSRFRGDGIVFATPTGSTAYSMSAGGPVVDARLGGIIVTQICAHIVHTPPLVFAGDRVLRAVPSGDNEPICVICDGAPGHVLEVGESVQVSQSGNRVPLIQFEDAEQLKSIDKKLKGR